MIMITVVTTIIIITIITTVIMWIITTINITKEDNILTTNMGINIEQRINSNSGSIRTISRYVYIYMHMYISLFVEIASNINFHHVCSYLRA